MLQVFLTFDTELWPDRKRPLSESLEPAFRRDILGETGKGAFGLARILDILDRHGLPGVFFVEALFASAAGGEPLRRIVELVRKRGRGHEVQLHLHTEWLRLQERPLVPVPVDVRHPAGEGEIAGQHLRHFEPAAQEELLRAGLANLRAAGADRVTAFRAGNFGADRDALRTLARIGLACDSSHNLAHLGRACAVDTAAPLLGPEVLDGVIEVPVTCFRDGFRRLRHAQINGCSALEMRQLLDRSAARGERTFVVVGHSNELLDGSRTRPDPVTIRRFERLCAHLSAGKDRFQVRGFDGLKPEDVLGPAPPGLLRGSLAGAVVRVAGQVRSRLG